MTKLPDGTHKFYGGIDPGKYGAIVVLSASGGVVECIDMPMTDMKAKGKDRKYDVRGLWQAIRRLSRLPSLVVGLENPQTRPGEGAERSRWFGQCVGYLEMALVAAGIEHYLISPNLWKGRLGLPGKTDPEAERVACRTFAMYYPRHADLVSFPSRHSGRADAGLLAHFLRTRTFSGTRSIVEQFGKDSPEVWCHVFKGKSRGRRRKGGPL